MKKVYLLLLLMVSSMSLYAQVGDSDAEEDVYVIKRDVLGIDNVTLSQEDTRRVISITRSSKEMEELPYTFFTISHDDIVRNGFITLCDVLKMVPGFRVSQPQSGELGEAFIQRGLVGNTYTKILINNVEVKPQGNYGMPLGANIPIRQAEAIHIIYGPASASYGNDACTGVINIITRKPQDKPFTSADIVVGTGNSSYINFQSGTKLGHGKYVGSFSIYGSNLAASNLNVPKDKDLFNRWNYFLQSGETFDIAMPDGQTVKVSKDMITPDLFVKYRDSQLFNDLKYYFYNYEGDQDSKYNFYIPQIADIPQRASQFGTEFSVGPFSLTYNMMHRMDFADQGQSPFTYNYQDNHNMLGEYIHRFTLNSDFKIGDVISNTSVRYINYRMDHNSSRGVNWSKEFQYSFGASDEVGIDENIKWEVFNNKETKRSLFLNAGVSYMYVGVLAPTLECDRPFDFKSYKPFSNSVDYTDPIFGDFGINLSTWWQAGAYLLSELDLNRLSLAAGTRFDYHSLWDASINPRFSALWKITEDNRFTIRASMGWAYKTPSMSQIYYCMGVAIPEVSPGVPYTIAVHHMPSDIKNITPEKIRSAEIGLRYFFKQRDGVFSNSYLEGVAFTNKVSEPLVRAWILLDKNVYPLPFYTGVTDFFDDQKGRNYTRAYINAKDAETMMYGLQAIGVLNNIYRPLNLRIMGSYSLTLGYEYVYNNDAEKPAFYKIDYIRAVPKRQAQFSVEFDFGDKVAGLSGANSKRFHFRADNVFCSKIARTYQDFNQSDNPYYWGPRYYNLDFSITGNITANLSAFVKVSNVTNALYGGIDVKNMDVDLPFNPQYSRTIRIGVSYDF